MRKGNPPFWVVAALAGRVAGSGWLADWLAGWRSGTDTSLLCDETERLIDGMLDDSSGTYSGETFGRILVRQSSGSPQPWDHVRRKTPLLPFTQPSIVPPVQPALCILAQNYARTHCHIHCRFHSYFHYPSQSRYMYARVSCLPACPGCPSPTQTKF